MFSGVHDSTHSHQQLAALAAATAAISTIEVSDSRINSVISAMIGAWSLATSTAVSTTGSNSRCSDMKNKQQQ